MAKGFGSRGMGGMGGGMNMNMIKQAQKMQQDMMRMQQELEEKTYEASAGGGVVTATVSGKRELKALEIDPRRGGPPTMWRCWRISSWPPSTTRWAHSCTICR